MEETSRRTFLGDINLALKGLTLSQNRSNAIVFQETLSYCFPDLSHRCDVTPLCINERRAVCSVLRVVHVHVRDGVLVVHRIVLKRDVVVRKVVRNVVAII